MSGSEIKDKVASFLQTELKLTLSAEKTLITHAQTGRARFLGYEIGIMYSSTKLNKLGTRGVNGVVGIYIPEDVIQAKRKRYLRDGKPIHRPELQNDNEYDIIIRYQGEYRGLVQYYGLAHNLAQLGYVKWTMETSLLKTLASKNPTSVTKESKRLKATTKTSDDPRKCLNLTIQREKKKPLIALLWRIVTQATQKSHHGRASHISVWPIKIRDSRKTPQRHMRSMWRKEERTDASRSTLTRPQQKGQKGDAALDESHDHAKAQEHPTVPGMS
jgi:hypothetical protein